jgi:hypothetical protein
MNSKSSRSLAIQKSDRMAKVASEILRDLYESTGFSIGDATPLHKRSHIDYAKHMLQLEPTFHVLASSHIKNGSVRESATVTQIPFGTLRDWRRHLLVEPEWKSYQNRKSDPRALTEEQEAEIAQEMQREYLDKGLYCPPKSPPRESGAEDRDRSQSEAINHIKTREQRMRTTSRILTS